MASFAEKARRLERIRQQLKRRYGEPPPLTVTQPLEHAMRTILAEEATTAQVDAAMERIRQHFVDMNDLRVSRPREIREVLGPDFPRSAYKARVLPRLLDQVFKQHNSMVWDFIETMGKVEMRAYFEKLEEVRPFVAATMARDCAGAHAFPVDNDVSRVLGRLNIVQPDASSESEMQTFLERAVKASRARETHWLVKRLGEEFCVVGEPHCGTCPLNAICPSAVLPGRRKGRKPRRKGAAAPPPSAGARKGRRRPTSPKAASRKHKGRRRK